MPPLSPVSTPFISSVPEYSCKRLGLCRVHDFNMLASGTPSRVVAALFLLKPFKL